MLLDGFGKDDNIVQVHEWALLFVGRLWNFHSSIERAGHVPQTERRLQKVMLSIVGRKCQFVSFTVVSLGLPVSWIGVSRWEYVCLDWEDETLVHSQYRIRILYDHSIQPPVVEMNT